MISRKFLKFRETFIKFLPKIMILQNMQTFDSKNEQTCWRNLIYELIKTFWISSGAKECSRIFWISQVCFLESHTSSKPGWEPRPSKRAQAGGGGERFFNKETHFSTLQPDCTITWTSFWRSSCLIFISSNTTPWRWLLENPSRKSLKNPSKNPWRKGVKKGVTNFEKGAH